MPSALLPCPAPAATAEKLRAPTTPCVPAPKHQRRSGWVCDATLPAGRSLCPASFAGGQRGLRARTVPTTPGWSAGLPTPTTVFGSPRPDAAALPEKSSLSANARQTTANTCSGLAARSVHSRAWVLNSPCGSRTSTQRMGTAGSPVLYQTAVAEATSTVRSPLPYQSSTVAGAQTVEGSSATSDRFGRRSPLRRGLPICPALRGGAGS